MTEILGSLSHRVDSIQSLCPSKNVDCCIMVTIKYQTTKRIDAPMLPCSEGFSDSLATRAATPSEQHNLVKPLQAPIQLADGGGHRIGMVAHLAPQRLLHERGSHHHHAAGEPS